MSDVFISYSRKDIAFARLLQESLKQSQVDTWIDWERIPVGEKWWTEICEAIENANVFMFIISNNSIGSTVCKDEINQALKNNKRIIPIIVDDLQPDVIKEFAPELPQFNWIIFARDHIFRIEENPASSSEKPEDRQVAFPAPPHFDEALEKLNKAIHTDWEWVKFHTKLQLRALEWEKHKDTSRLLRGKELHEAELWLAQIGITKDPQPTVLQRQFVLASRKAEAGRQRLTMGASVGGLIILSIFLVIAILARQSAQSNANSRATAESQALAQKSTAVVAEGQAVAERATAEANLARSESLRMAAEAENILTQPGGNVETAALLSVRALQGGIIPQADTALQKSLLHLYALRTLNGHTDGVISVAFSPDGKYVLTGSLDKTAKLWDLDKGVVVRTFVGHTGAVESVVFSPDGKYVLTGSSDKSAKLWDAATGKVLQTFNDPTNIPRTAVEMKRSCHSVAFSPDGKYVLTASDDGTPKLWDANTGLLVRAFNGHTSIVRSVAFSPDGEYVLTGGLDGTARLWNATTGEQLHLFDLTNWVLSVAFSPDGKTIFIGTTGDATLWDASTYAIMHTFSGNAQGAISAAFSPDGEYILTASLSQATANLWNTTSGELVRNYSGHLDTVNSVAFSPDGQYILTGSQDTTAKVWEATSNEIARAFIGHTDIVESVAFSPDGKHVLTGSDDSTARLWDATTANETVSFSGHAGPVYSVAFSPDEKYVLTGSGDSTAKLWDAATGTEVRTFSGHTGSVNSVAFSPDGKHVLTGSADRTARLWDASTGTELHTFRGHTQAITGVAFSPDGKYVLTGSADWDAKLWDATSGAEIRTFKDGSSVQVVAFSPDGKYVLTGDLERTATLWDTNSGALVRTFSGHTGYVTGVAFSPDGKYVLTGSYDFTAKLWDVATGAEVRTFGGHTDSINSVAFSPDGKYILTGSWDKTAELWDTDPSSTINWACAHLTRDLTTQERTEHFITVNLPTCPVGNGLAALPPIAPGSTNSIPPGKPTEAFAGQPASTAVAAPKVTEVDVADSFDNNQYGWPALQQWKDNGNVQDMQVQNGELEWSINCALSEGCYYLWAPGGLPVVSDFSLSMDVKRTPGSTNGYAGIIFRYVDGYNYYMFSCDDVAGSFLIWRVVNNSSTVVANWLKSSAIKANQTNRLRVEASGASFTFFINNVNVYSAEMTGIPAGRVGVDAGNTSQGKISLSFDNLSLQENANTITATATTAKTATATSATRLNTQAPAPLQWDDTISDPLSSNVNGWPTWNDQGNQWCTTSLNFQDGSLLWTLQATPNNGCINYAYPDNSLVSDFDTALDVKRSSGDGRADFGIGFRISDSYNYSAFVINDADKNFEIRRLQNNSWSTVENWKSASAIKSTGYNHLAISARGKDIYFFINNTLVDKIEDSGIASGNIGIISEVYDGENVSISYENFLLNGIK